MKNPNFKLKFIAVCLLAFGMIDFGVEFAMSSSTSCHPESAQVQISTAKPPSANLYSQTGEEESNDQRYTSHQNSSTAIVSDVFQFSAPSLLSKAEKYFHSTHGTVSQNLYILHHQFLV